VTVRERPEVQNGRLVRRFRTTGAATVWFVLPDGVTDLQVTGGTREGAYARLNGAAAQEFTVTYPIPASAGAPTPVR
jgi:hypothetical protein